MKRFLIYICLAAGLLSACSKEAELKPSTDFDLSLDLPENTAWEKRAKAFYEKYNTYLRIDYTEKDVTWNWDGYANFKYSLPPSEADAVALFDFIEDDFLSIYPDDLLKKILPYQLLLADTLKATKNTSTQSYALFGMNHIIFGGASAGTFPDTEDKKVTALQEMHENLALSLLSKIERQPTEFWSVSTYAREAIVSDEAMYERGYVFRNRILPPDETKDYSTFVAWVASTPKAEIESISNQYPLIAKKLDYLRNYYQEELGANLDDIMQP